MSGDISLGNLTMIEPQEHDGQFAIPRTMKLVYIQKIANRLRAYVENWTAAGDYDERYFDLYSLSQGKTFDPPVSFKRLEDNAPVAQEWYYCFGKPAKQAIKVNGAFHDRDAVG